MSIFGRIVELFHAIKRPVEDLWLESWAYYTLLSTSETDSMCMHATTCY